VASLKPTSVTLGTDNVAALARFYQRLLGWDLASADDNWAMLRNPAGGVGLNFQHEPHHAPAVWPGEPGQQQMMVHLEILVDELDAALEHAQKCGAKLAGFQPQADVRVCIDPAGHPFCLYQSG